MTSATRIAIAVVQWRGCLLVGVRPPGTPLEGKAEFPGGKLEPGETLEQAACRECHEETGLQVECLGPLGPDHVQRFTYPHDTVELYFFDCRPSQPDAPTPRPPFRWIPREQLSQLNFPPANTPILRALES